MSSIIVARPLEPGERLLYHVFADGVDDFYLESERDRAFRRYDELTKTHANVRLYWEIEDEETGETIEEDYIKGQGEFPW
jgi:hypothetical protein